MDPTEDTKGIKNHIIRVEFSGKTPLHHAQEFQNYLKNVQDAMLRGYGVNLFRDFDGEDSTVRVTLEPNAQWHTQTRVVAMGLVKFDSWSFIGPDCPNKLTEKHNVGRERLHDVNQYGTGHCWCCPESRCRYRISLSCLNYMTYKEFKLWLAYGGDPSNVAAILDQSIKSDVNWVNTVEAQRKRVMEDLRTQAKHFSFAMEPLKTTVCKPEGMVAVKVSVPGVPDQGLYTRGKGSGQINAAEDAPTKAIAKSAWEQPLLGMPLVPKQKDDELLKSYRDQRLFPLKAEPDHGKAYNVQERVAELKSTVILVDSTKKLYEFICGINFQDHPVADQRKIIELMSEVRKALKEFGVGNS